MRKSIYERRLAQMGMNDKNLVKDILIQDYNLGVPHALEIVERTGMRGDEAIEKAVKWILR